MKEHTQTLGLVEQKEQKQGRQAGVHGLIIHKVGSSDHFEESRGELGGAIFRPS
jgi:hypothetical protein